MKKKDKLFIIGLLTVVGIAVVSLAVYALEVYSPIVENLIAGF